MTVIIDHDNKAYRAKWNHLGKNKYNGAFYYSKEIAKHIIPRVNTDRNWVLVNCQGQGVDHAIVFIHNNLHPEHYDWLAQYDDLILVCGVPQTVPLVEHLGKAIYLPLSVDTQYLDQFMPDHKTKKTAFIGRQYKRKDISFPSGTEIIEGLPRQHLLREMAKFENVYAVGRCAVEAKYLGANILPYDPRYPDPDIWQVLDNRDAATILQQELDKIEAAPFAHKGINTVYPTSTTKENAPAPKVIIKGTPQDKNKPALVQPEKKENAGRVIIDHTHPEYIKARNKLGRNKYNGAYYYSKEIVERIIPLVNTDRNWLTIKAGDNAIDHSIVFVHNNRNFEGPYSYLKPYKDMIYVVGLPDMVEPASKLGKAIYLPLSVDVAYVEQFKRKRKTKKRAFVGRKETRRDWKFPEGTDLVELLPREELLTEMAKYKEVYAIGRTAIEAKILGCKVLPFHPRLPDPELWQILDNTEAAAMLQKKLDIIDGGGYRFEDLDKLVITHKGGMYTLDESFLEQFGRLL